jgi:hypothetical protein
VPWFVLSLFIVSIIAIFFGGVFNTVASRHQNITWNDTRPSWGMTIRAAEKSLLHNFATGYGPNSFGGVWSLVKPPALSGGDASGNDFTQGVGFVPTQIATTGIIGGILWILFFGAVLRFLIKRTKAGFTHSLDRYFAIGIGMGILYLGILAWVYVPGSYLLALLAVFIGAFIAVFHKKDSTEDRMFSFIKDPRASFFGILGITILIVGTLVLGYVGFRKMVSFIHYTRGEVYLNQNKLTLANNEISVAAAYADHDIYHQQLASFALSDVTQIISKTTQQQKI